MVRNFQQNCPEKKSTKLSCENNDNIEVVFYN